MKIIGESGNNKYICIVDHYEIEKFLNLYYDKLKKPKIGDEIDLSRGYDWAHDIEFFLSKHKILLNPMVK